MSTSLAYHMQFSVPPRIYQFPLSTEATSASIDDDDLNERQEALLLPPPLPPPGIDISHQRCVLCAKKLTQNDSGGRVVLPCGIVKANLPFLVPYKFYRLQLTDNDGNEWTFHFKNWVNGSKKRRVYVLENVGSYIKAYNLKTGDTIGICSNGQDPHTGYGRFCVEANTPAVIMAADKPTRSPCPLEPEPQPPEFTELLNTEETGTCTRNPNCKKPKGHTGFCCGRKMKRLIFSAGLPSHQQSLQQSHQQEQHTSLGDHGMPLSLSQGDHSLSHPSAAAATAAAAQQSSGSSLLHNFNGAVGQNFMNGLDQFFNEHMSPYLQSAAAAAAAAVGSMPLNPAALGMAMAQFMGAVGSVLSGVVVPEVPDFLALDQQRQQELFYQAFAIQQQLQPQQQQQQQQEGHQQQESEQSTQAVQQEQQQQQQFGQMQDPTVQFPPDYPLRVFQGSPCCGLPQAAAPPQREGDGVCAQELLSGFKKPGDPADVVAGACIGSGHPGIEEQGTGDLSLRNHTPGVFGDVSNDKGVALMGGDLDSAECKVPSLTGNPKLFLSSGRNGNGHRGLTSISCPFTAPSDAASAGGPSVLGDRSDERPEFSSRNFFPEPQDRLRDQAGDESRSYSEDASAVGDIGGLVVDELRRSGGGEGERGGGEGEGEEARFSSENDRVEERMQAQAQAESQEDAIRGWCQCHLPRVASAGKVEDASDKASDCCPSDATDHPYNSSISISNNSNHHHHNNSSSASSDLTAVSLSSGSGSGSEMLLVGGYSRSLSEPPPGSTPTQSFRMCALSATLPPNKEAMLPQPSPGDGETVHGPSTALCVIPDVLVEAGCNGWQLLHSSDRQMDPLDAFKHSRDGGLRETDSRMPGVTTQLLRSASAAFERQLPHYALMSSPTAAQMNASAAATQQLAGELGFQGLGDPAAATAVQFSLAAARTLSYPPRSRPMGSMVTGFPALAGVPGLRGLLVQPQLPASAVPYRVPGPGCELVCTRTPGCPKGPGHQGFCAGHKGFRKPKGPGTGPDERFPVPGPGPGQGHGAVPGSGAIPSRSCDPHAMTSLSFPIALGPPMQRQGMHPSSITSQLPVPVPMRHYQPAQQEQHQHPHHQQQHQHQQQQQVLQTLTHIPFRSTSSASSANNSLSSHGPLALRSSFPSTAASSARQKDHFQNSNKFNYATHSPQTSSGVCLPTALSVGTSSGLDTMPAAAANLPEGASAVLVLKGVSADDELRSAFYRELSQLGGTDNGGDDGGGGRGDLQALGCVTGRPSHAPYSQMSQCVDGSISLQPPPPPPQSQPQLGDLTHPSPMWNIYGLTNESSVNVPSHSAQASAYPSPQPPLPQRPSSSPSSSYAHQEHQAPDCQQQQQQHQQHHQQQPNFMMPYKPPSTSHSFGLDNSHSHSHSHSNSNGKGSGADVASAPMLSMHHPMRQLSLRSTGRPLRVGEDGQASSPSSLSQSQHDDQDPRQHPQQLEQQQHVGSLEARMHEGDFSPAIGYPFAESVQAYPTSMLDFCLASQRLPAFPPRYAYDLRIDCLTGPGDPLVKGATDSSSAAGCLQGGGLLGALPSSVPGAIPVGGVVCFGDGGGSGGGGGGNHADGCSGIALSAAKGMSQGPVACSSSTGRDVDVDSLANSLHRHEPRASSSGRVLVDACPQRAPASHLPPEFVSENAGTSGFADHPCQIAAGSGLAAVGSCAEGSPLSSHAMRTTRQAGLSMHGGDGEAASGHEHDMSVSRPPPCPVGLQGSLPSPYARCTESANYGLGHPSSPEDMDMGGSPKRRRVDFSLVSPDALLASGALPHLVFSAPPVV